MKEIDEIGDSNDDTLEQVAGSPASSAAIDKHISPAPKVQAAPLPRTVDLAQPLKSTLKETRITDLATTKQPIAVRLTEEQTKLLLSAKYPNNTHQQNAALNSIYTGSAPINVMNETIALDYSEAQKRFFATLDKDLKPTLDQTLTQLQAEKQENQKQEAPTTILQSAKVPPLGLTKHNMERD